MFGGSGLPRSRGPVSGVKTIPNWNFVAICIDLYSKANPYPSPLWLHAHCCARSVSACLALSKRYPANRETGNHGSFNLAGFPLTVAPGGTFLVTTAPAPIMARSPILMPGKRTAPPPIDAPLCTTVFSKGVE